MSEEGGRRKCRAGVVFLICLLCLSIFGPVNSDDSVNFVNNKEQQVQAIAAQAAVNYANTCDLISTCQTPQNCSRRECYPLENQKNEYSCVYVNNNTICHNRTGAPCNTVLANFERGYVRVPPLDLSPGGTLEQFLGSTICAQRELDATFFTVNSSLNNAAQNYFYNLYFGAVDGSFRYYPGRELLNYECGLYDPRIRPWFTAAFSILKDVVVILDTGTAMVTDFGFLDPSKSSLAIGKTMLKLFVETLTAGDRVTVIPVNESGTDPISTNSQYMVPLDGLDLDDPTFEAFQDYIINDTTFSGDGAANGNGQPSNFTAAFTEAQSVFNDTLLNAVKIVILITDSKMNSPSSSDSAAGLQFQKPGSRLFVYDMSGSNTWGQLACQGGGVNQQPFRSTVVANPLLTLSPYFSFLARSRIAANNGSSPFWISPYDDASDLGQVITVAYPAMSSDGLQLIGVAAIDVQLAGLDPVLENGIENVLSGRKSRTIAQYPSGAPQPTNCNEGFVNLCGNVQAGSTQSLCYPSTTPASDKQLEALICCQDCTNHRSRNVFLWVAIGILSALFVLLLIPIYFIVKRLRNREPTLDETEPSLSKYSYEAIRRATNDFDPQNILGKGAFGVVYKACLGDEVVAVKELNQPADRAEDFRAELKILGITSHPNLVELKGTCFQATRCFLVYELVENGDLHSWLWPDRANIGMGGAGKGGRFLNWNQRRKIARGVARGLNYLHRGLVSDGKVFHLDIKPRNILLEEHFNPKIADFGISQLYEPGYTFRVASVVRGTFGYIAPEVLQGQVKPNSKLDTYSYGMVLLQLITGRKIDDPDVEPYLLQWAKNHVEDGNFDKVVDEQLIEAVEEGYREAVMANGRVLIILALRCLSERPDSRPEMSDILEAIDDLPHVADFETPSSSDREDAKPKVNRLVRSGSRGSSQIYGFPRFFSSEPRVTTGKLERDPGRTISISTPLNAEEYRDPHHSRCNSEHNVSRSLTGFSVESLYETAVENLQDKRERFSKTLRRTASSSKP